MKKQILSIIMAGCLLLSMTACSSDKKNTKSASEQTTADASTSTTSGIQQNQFRHEHRLK